VLRCGVVIKQRWAAVILEERNGRRMEREKKARREGGTMDEWDDGRRRQNWHR